MPQGGLEALKRLDQDPLAIKAFQYDIVCNGVELSSGAIRNHRPEIMYKAFEIAGLAARSSRRSSAACSTRSSSARRRTAASAPGVDRIVMLLATSRTCARSRLPDEPAGAGPADGRARRVPPKQL
jgi:aspartyl-tRNA synthetase